MADTRRRETIARGRESEWRASGPLRRIIGGILGETGKDRMYEEKGKGARPGQDNEDTYGSHYYLLVDPRPGEAPNYDYSAIVQCTGTERSPVRPL